MDLVASGVSLLRQRLHKLDVFSQQLLLGLLQGVFSPHFLNEVQVVLLALEHLQILIMAQRHLGTVGRSSLNSLVTGTCILWKLEEYF